MMAEDVDMTHNECIRTLTDDGGGGGLDDIAIMTV